MSFWTIVSIVIIVVILSIFIFINFDYSKKYKKSEKDLYYEALDLLITGKLKEAYQTLLALIKNDTNNVKAYLKLGEVLREIGKPDRALKVHKSLEIRKDLTSYERIELFKNISLDYKHLNKIDDAISESLQILKLEKHNEWALSHLIELYKLVDDWSSSKRYLQIYQKITGDVDSRILGLYIVKQGKIELDKGNFVKARSYFEEAVNLNNELGLCYKLIGDSYSQESEVMHEKSKEENYERCLEQAKELLSKALSMWVKYAQSKPAQSKNVIHLIKDSLFVLERYSELEFILKDLVERDSNNIDALINLADYYSNEGESQKSINLLDSLKEKDKQSVLARMVRLKLRVKISDSISNDIKKEFDDLVDSMTKTEKDISDLDDEDAIWLAENSFDS